MSVPLPSPSLPLERQDVLTLFAMLLWGEARGEPHQGKVAVACVVRNRVVLSPRFGDGWRGVMLKPKQFSCFNPGDANLAKMLNPTAHGSLETWQACGAVAESIYYDDVADITCGSLFYFTIARPPGVSVWPPKWSRELVKRCEVGAHVFYGEP